MVVYPFEMVVRLLLGQWGFVVGNQQRLGEQRVVIEFVDIFIIMYCAAHAVFFFVVSQCIHGLVFDVDVLVLHSSAVFVFVARCIVIAVGYDNFAVVFHVFI